MLLLSTERTEFREILLRARDLPSTDAWGVWPV